MKRALLDRLLAHREAKEPVALATWLGSGEQRLLRPDASEDAVGRAARDALRDDRCVTLETDAGRVFVQPHNPPLRLVVVGAVHIAQPLVRIAHETGWEVVVVDPRHAFASPERFPDVALSHAWPDEALRELALDRRCAVVTLTHDPKLDDPALAVALRSDAFYVGALGSRRTQANRGERLRALGFAEAEIARIHGPVGLDIGARSPAEIAVSIMAEITLRLRRPDA